MSHDAHASHGHAVAEAFSDAEWQELQSEDLKAGKAVVSLMAGIFFMGVILYLIVAWSIVS